jgi:hypothetical protein
MKSTWQVSAVFCVFVTLLFSKVASVHEQSTPVNTCSVDDCVPRVMMCMHMPFVLATHAANREMVVGCRPTYDATSRYIMR